MTKKEKIPKSVISQGRPPIYTDELADKVCALIASGKSLRTICAMESMPSMATIFSWIRLHPSFLKQYEKAKEDQADALVEEMLDIADDGTNDWMEQKDASGATIGYKINGEHVQRSRLRLDARKWIASKLKAKKYGDKMQNEITNPDGSMTPQAITVKVVTKKE